MVHVVQLHLMTFRDISPHIMLSLTSLFMLTACWAPEVKAPTPKSSPAELAGLAIASASASPISSVGQPSQNVQRNSTSDVDLLPNGVEHKPVENAPAPSDRYPYIAQIQGISDTQVPLLGHGGGLIMTLTEVNLQAATIEVLEERNGKLRVLCQGCSKDHPNQAGWISAEYLKRVN